MTRRPAFNLLLLATLLVPACGGGDSSPFPTTSNTADVQFKPRHPEAAEATVAPDEAARQLLDWAEANYAAYFPKRQATQKQQPFLFRFYPTTGIYLGVAFGGNATYPDGVYVMGGAFGSAPIFLGPVTRFITPVSPANAIIANVVGNTANPTLLVLDANQTTRLTITKAAGTSDAFPRISQIAVEELVGTGGKPSIMKFDASGRVTSILDPVYGSMAFTYFDNGTARIGWTDPKTGETIEEQLSGVSSGMSTPTESEAIPASPMSSPILRKGRIKVQCSIAGGAPEPVDDAELIVTRPYRISESNPNFFYDTLQPTKVGLGEWEYYSYPTTYDRNPSRTSIAVGNAIDAVCQANSYVVNNKSALAGAMFLTAVALSETGPAATEVAAAVPKILKLVEVACKANDAWSIIRSLELPEQEVVAEIAATGQHSSSELI